MERLGLIATYDDQKKSMMEVRIRRIIIHPPRTEFRPESMHKTKRFLCQFDERISKNFRHTMESALSEARFLIALITVRMRRSRSCIMDIPRRAAVRWPVFPGTQWLLMGEYLRLSEYRKISPSMMLYSCQLTKDTSGTREERRYTQPLKNSKTEPQKSYSPCHPAVNCCCAYS